MLQVLIDFFRHVKVLEVLHGDRLLYFLHSQSFVSVLNCLRTTKSFAEYDQVLQLGPLVFPNRSGIIFFGSTNRICDFVSI